MPVGGEGNPQPERRGIVWKGILLTRCRKASESIPLQRRRGGAMRRLRGPSKSRRPALTPTRPARSGCRANSCRHRPAG
jgi:hypothetical protein